MSDCFPPIPLYIVVGIVMAMFTAVTANINGRAETLLNSDLRFAGFLLLVLAVPFVQLLLLLGTALVSGRSTESGCKMLEIGSDAWWLLAFHFVTVAPMLIGTVYWFWRRSSVGHQLESPAPAENAEGSGG